MLVTKSDCKYRYIFIDHLIDYRKSIVAVLGRDKVRKDTINAINNIINVASLLQEDDKYFYVIQTHKIRELGTSPSTLNRIVDKLGLFFCVNNKYHTQYRIAKRYVATPLLEDILRHYLDSGEYKSCVVYRDAKLDKLLDKEPAKLPKDFYVQLGYDYVIMQTLRVDELQDYVYSEENPYCNDPTVMTNVLRFISHVKANHNECISTYNKCSTDRLVCDSDGNLQALPKIFRRIVLRGHWDIDMVNAHYSICSQLLLDIGINGVINHYVNNTSQVRSGLANDLGLDVDQIKAALLSVLFGARISRMRKDSALTKILGGKDKANEFVLHPIVTGILTETRLLINHYKDELTHAIVRCDDDKPSDRKKLAYWLQNIEASILRLCVKEYRPTSLLYDGFTTKLNVDTDRLSELVYNQLGKKIMFKKEQF